MSVDLARVEEVFGESLAKANAAAREKYLNEACGGDADLRSRVEALLAAHNGADSFLRLPETDEATAPLLPLSEGPGTTIGRYKLLEEIGEGGFGVVFMAEQDEPIRRRVALKVIKLGMDTKQVVARFEAERQALAMMDHPNIARVLDAGATDTGRPYFVMELVKGIPITTYCDQQKLSTDERLELFIAVCSAVQHAHQKGIIHRDLKPSNVMVTLHDDRPVPKIIDFGIAKATQARLTEKTLFTEFRQLIGTPAYMSPEQAHMIGLDVDTRSDIYSLGVLLYELLTGTMPFDSKELLRSGYDEMRRIIREVEPPRPSTRLSTMASSGAIGARAIERGSDPKQLAHILRGDLDWIVMRCLEKDRNRRFESASALADDVKRHLADEPVQACPPSTIYRLRKSARRNKTLLAAGGAVAAALVVGLGLFTWQYFRATAESSRAQAVSDFLQRMLRSPDEEQAKGDQYTLRQLLDNSSAELKSQLADQPAAAADIHATIGRAYSSLNLPKKAEPHLKKVIELRRQVDGPEHERVGGALVTYAWTLRDLGRYDDAEAQIREALGIYRRQGATGFRMVHALSALQAVLLPLGRDDEAERVTDEAKTIAENSGEGYYDLGTMLMRSASRKIDQGRFAEAEQLARESIEMQRNVPGDRPLSGAWGLKVLSRALQSQQKLPAAEQAARESLEIFRRRYAADHPNVRNARDQLRNVLKARGDKSGLEALDKEEAEIAMRSGSPDYRLQLGELLANPSITAATSLDFERLSKAAAARNEEAHRQIRQAIETYGRVATEYPDDLNRRADALGGYVTAIRHCVASPDFAGEVDELNRRLNADLPKLLAAFPGSSECGWRTAMIYRGWAFELSAYSNYIATAEHALSESVEILEKLSQSDPSRPKIWWYLSDTYFPLGETQWRMGMRRDAEAAFRRAIEIDHQHAAEIAADPVPKTSYWVALHDMLLAYHLASMQHEDQAVEFVRQAKLNLEGVTDPVDLATAHWQLAGAQVWLGDVAGYRETCQALADLPADRLDYLSKLRRLFACTYAPNTIEDSGLLVQSAEEDLASGPLDLRYLEFLTLGAVHYRAGDYQQAEGELAESIAANPRSPGPGADLSNPQHLFLAMTKWQLGKREEARRLLAETLPEVDKALKSPATNWIGRAPLEVLAREAEGLIRQDSPKGISDSGGATPIVPRNLPR